MKHTLTPFRWPLFLAVFLTVTSLAGCDLPSQIEEDPEPPKEILPRNGSSPIPFYTETVAKRADGVSDRMRAINRTRKFLREQQGYFLVSSSKTDRDANAPFEYKVREIDFPVWIKAAPVDTITYVFTRTDKNGEIVNMAIARVPNVPEIKQMMRHWLGNKRSLSKFAPQKRSGSLLPATIQTENCAPEYQDPRCIDNEQYYDPDLGSYVLCEVVICDTVPDPDDEFEGDDGGGGFPGGEDWGDLPEPGGGNVDVPPPNVSAADYYAMNEEERRLCRERPLHCVAYIGVSALTLGQMHLCNAFGCFQDAGFDGSPHNAVQHGLFAGMLALTPPFTPLSALEWTDAHEHNLLSVVHQVKNLGTSSLRAGGPVPLAIANNEFQCYMDAHNNRAAIHYAMMLHGLAPDYATRIALLQYWVIDNVMNNTGIFHTYAYGPFPGNSPVPPGSVHPITGQVVPGSLNWSDIGWNSLIYTFTYGEMFVDPP